MLSSFYFPGVGVEVVSRSWQSQGMDILLDDIEIRRASVADAQSIANVHVLSWQQGYAGIVPAEFLAGLDPEKRAAQWVEHLNDEASSVWVAHGYGRVFGFSSIGPSRDEDAEANTQEIYTIYLDPEAWGTGVARELMHTMLEPLSQADPVTLWVLAENERARRFYQRHGFSADGVERLDDFSGSGLLEVRLRRN